MALVVSVPLDIGLTCPAAYVRISSVTFTRGEVNVGIEIYVSTADFAAGRPAAKTGAYGIPWIAAPSFSYAYTQLKTFPEFAGAIDV